MVMRTGSCGSKLPGGETFAAGEGKFVLETLQLLAMEDAFGLRTEICSETTT